MSTSPSDPPPGRRGGPLPVTLELVGRLDPHTVSAVRGLVDEVSDADGTVPLSEHVMLHLHAGGDSPARHLLARTADGALVGYAHLDVTDPVEGASAELAVCPGARSSGVGAAMLSALLEASPGGRLRLWAHGEHPGAARLAQRRGFVRGRTLWQMRRSLLTPLPAAVLPPRVTVRTFEPGRDEAAWVRVNNAAFAHHPDQGGFTVPELELREGEPWFDAHGFFLAERDGALLGFHWTKVHGSDRSSGAGHGHDHPPIGEVYVVGVAPEAAGHGLGQALTLIGLRHLRARGLTSAMLYVDDSNAAAMHVYERLGFVRWSSDVSFVHGAPPLAPGGLRDASVA